MFDIKRWYLGVVHVCVPEEDIHQPHFTISSRALHAFWINIQKGFSGARKTVHVGGGGKIQIIFLPLQPSREVGIIHSFEPRLSTGCSVASIFMFWRCIPCE